MREERKERQFVDEPNSPCATINWSPSFPAPPWRLNCCACKSTELYLCNWPGDDVQEDTLVAKTFLFALTSLINIFSFVLVLFFSFFFYL